jgi:thiol-disulfide isomerase/thioredoxin
MHSGFVRRRPLSRLAIGSIAVVVAVPVLRAEPPPDERVEAIFDAAEEYYREHRRDFDEGAFAVFAETLVVDLDIESMTASQLARLHWVIGVVPARRGEALGRLDRLAAGNTVDGYVAAVTAARMSLSPPADDRVGPVRRALAHGAMRRALERDALGTIMLLQDLVSKDESGAVAASVADELVGVRARLDASLPPQAMTMARAYFRAVVHAGDAVAPATRESIRARLAELTRAAIDRARADGSLPPGELDWLRKDADLLAGAFARGRLIDHAAPELNIAWTSADGDVATLADLKGRVVVLDFWATWCGPCLAAFPGLRALQARYEGYDVVILGVTSLQGRHYGGGDPIDTSDAPEREYELMAGFMVRKDMTWDVAFSAQDVFNPDFGVQGIPHLAIIDAAGVVRFNGLPPDDPGKTEKIDSLLREAGLRVPADD